MTDFTPDVDGYFCRLCGQECATSLALKQHEKRCCPCCCCGSEISVFKFCDASPEYPGCPNCRFTCCKMRKD